MAESEGQEKTEDPTSKRLRDARTKGQIPRSRESGTFFVLMSGVIGLFVIAPYLGLGMKEAFQVTSSLTREQAFDINEMSRVFVQAFSSIGIPLLFLCLFTFLSALIGNIFLGGLNFSTQALMPKFNKLNPISGFKRMFSLNSLMELTKSLLKVICIGSICYLMVSTHLNEIMRLSYINPAEAAAEAMMTLFFFMVVIVCAMIPIVLIDIPWQIHHYREQLKMTKQEVKDEYKDIEGNPQIKSRIRRMQYEMASRRMMSDVPKADVVVTNPTHYAVALRYDPLSPLAPVVVAKGVEEIAEKIKEIAYAYEIPVMQLPPLARSLYFTTQIGHEIPKGLFKAVAQVLAYVMGMRSYREGRSKRPPREIDRNLPIPEELRF